MATHARVLEAGTRTPARYAGGPKLSQLTEVFGIRKGKRRRRRGVRVELCISPNDLFEPVGAGGPMWLGRDVYPGLHPIVLKTLFLSAHLTN